MKNHSPTRLRKLFAAIIALFTTISTTAQFKYGDLYYSPLSDTEVQIVPKMTDDGLLDPNPELTQIIIPEKVYDGNTEYTVTSIGREAFTGWINLTQVLIPTTVTKIGNFAFRNCTNLKSIDIPHGVVYMGDQAFRYSGLERISIPASLTHFSFDPDLYGDNQYPLPGHTFYLAENLKEIIISPDHPYLASCSSDTGASSRIVSKDGKKLIYIPTGQTEGKELAITEYDQIADFAFYGLELDKLTLQVPGLNLSRVALTNSKIKHIVFGPASDPIRWNHSFYLSGAFSALGESIEKVSLYCVVQISNSDMSIATLYYGEERNQQEITVEIGTPDGAQSEESLKATLSTLMFTELSAIAKDFELNTDKLFVRNAGLYFSSTKELVGWADKAHINHVTLHPECRAIADRVFENSTIQSIDIPDAMESIGKRAFMNSDLTSISLGKNIRHLGDSLCMKCDKLTEAKILSGDISGDGTVCKIPDNAFSRCSALSKIYFGEQINYVGRAALFKIDPSANIYIKNSNPPSYYTPFMGIEWSNVPTTTLYVPTASVDLYKSYRGNYSNSTKFNIIGFDYTGIDNLTSDTRPTVTVANGGINVTASNATEVKVYTASGLPVYSGSAGYIALAPGNYIVRVGTHAHKIKL